jgi:hypothetical protein
MCQQCELYLAFTRLSWLPQDNAMIGEAGAVKIGKAGVEKTGEAARVKIGEAGITTIGGIFIICF